MSRPTKKILIIDTETVGELNYPIAYDIGLVVTDRNGNIYHQAHFVVKEIFGDLQRMCSAYYSNKFQSYIDTIYQQETEPLPFTEIVKKINAICEVWDISTLSAYNLSFDKRSMKNTAVELLGTEKWLDREMNDLCIMCAACDILYGAKYCKTARTQGWITEKGNIKTSAECGYRYITGSYDFEEAHKGLQDCLIEKEILTAIYKRHKPFNGKIKAFPFREVWKRERKMQEEEQKKI